MKKLWIGLVLLVLVLAAAGMATAEETITLNTPKTVEISIPGEVAIYQFTPTQTGMYRYYSSSVNDGDWNYTMGYLLDNEKQLIKQDGGRDDNHFSMMRRLTAGRTYYFASFYLDDNKTGSFRIHLDLIDGVYAKAQESIVYTQPGQKGTAEVTAYSPNGGLTYQWYDGNTAINGATGSKYTFPALTAAKTFRCVVKDAANNTQEVTVEARISSGLRVSCNSTEIDCGGSATLTVTATATYGADQLTYQWHEEEWDEDGQWIQHELEGETGNSITLTNVTTCRNLCCEVTDINGESMVCWGWINIIGAYMSLDIEPDDGNREKTVEAGDSVTMTVQALKESYPISYQWYKVNYYSWGSDWERIEGATDTSYTLTNCYTPGEYMCVAVNSIGVTDEVNFYISITNGFTATADGDNEIELNPGDATSLQVKTTNSIGTVTYQWYHYEEVYERNVPVRGANSASYQLSGNVRSGSWYCMATDETGVQSSVWFSVNVASEFSATADSETNLTMNVGDEATLKVKATGTNLSYRWYEKEYNNTYDRYNDNELIEDAETDSLTITCDGRSEYECRVSDPYGHFAYIIFYVQVDNAFSVNTNQTYYSVEPGESVTLSMTGTCTNGMITYRWVYNGGQSPAYSIVKESGESFLKIDAVGPGNFGTYTMSAHDEYGNRCSYLFTISIENHLSAEAVGDDNITIQAGENILLSVAASSDDGELSYQWYEETQGQNGPDYYYQPMTNQTQATLQLTNVQQATSYYCQVSDAYGGRVPVWFYISIDNELTVHCMNYEPDIYVQTGDTATLTVEASCRTGELTYQWYRAGWDGEYWYDQIIDGETGVSYTTDPISESEEYYCQVKDQYGNRDNAWFNVYIDNELTVTPVGSRYKTTEPGGDVTLAVRATCAEGGVTYKWYKGEWYDNGNGEGWYNYDGNIIDGATEASYTAEEVTGYSLYRCEVNDEYGGNEYVEFYVSIENGLTVYGKFTGGSRHRVYGGQATMKVIASCKHGDLQYQWYRYDAIDNTVVMIPDATESQYTYGPLYEKEKNFWCRVTDIYGNSYDQGFVIYIQSELTAEPEGDNVFRSTEESITMAVNASNEFGDTDFTYTWYNPNNVMIASGYENSCTLSSPSAGRYRCEVNDENGISTEVYFYVMDEAVAYGEGGSRSYLVGETATLRVVAWNEAGDLTYQWYDGERYNQEENDFEPIEGATDPTYSFTVNGPRNLICQVTGTGLNTRVGFDTFATNGLEIDCNELSKVYVIPANGGVQLTMSVECEPDSELTYCWYKDEQCIEGETDRTLTLTEAGAYSFRVSDQYGDSALASVYAVNGQAEAVSEGQTFTGPENGAAVYQINPAVTGTYEIETNRWVGMYIPGRYYNDWRFDGIGTVYLEKGQVYYLELRSGDSFKYTLVNGQEVQTEYNIILPEGEKLEIPWDRCKGNKWIEFDYAVSSAPSVIRVIDRNVDLRKEGTADLTVGYQDGTEIVYHVTVTTGNTLTMPGGLQTIEADAFNGDASLMFVRIGSSVQTVKRGAFANTGSICLIVEGGNVQFEEGVFSNSNPVIIGEGDAIWYFRSNGIPCFYFR